MAEQYHPSRRDILKAGIAGVPATALMTGASAKEAQAAENRKRITVVVIMGDYWHNPISREMNLRGILGKMDWRILFTSHSEFLTSEVIGEADLLITQRWNGSKGYTLGFSPEGLVDSRPPDVPYMTAEQEDAIIDNIRNRGMGFLSLHCAFWNARPKIKEMLGHEQGFHPHVQSVLIKKFNQEHPITRGMEPWAEDDEQFFAKILNPDHTILFYSEGTRDHRETVSGWCFGYGKGRVVQLLPGHTEFVWQHPKYQELILRASLWLLRKPIPDNTADLVAEKSVWIRPVGGFGEAGLSTNL
jgi:type 1 glutamine amidotransferase